MKKATHVLGLTGLFVGSAVLGFALVLLSVHDSDGGTVRGRVIFSGKLPEPKAFALAKYPNASFCAKHSSTSKDGRFRLLKELRVGVNRALQDAIVAITDIHDKAWMIRSDATFVHADLCEWTPYTGVLVNRGRLVVENRDAVAADPRARIGVLHRSHTFELLKGSATTLFNIALSNQSDKVETPITLRTESPGAVVRLQCDEHEFMQAWFLPVTSPYFAKVKENGTFELVNVPPGAHTLTAWHPIAGALEQQVEVAGNTIVNVEFKLTGTYAVLPRENAHRELLANEAAGSQAQHHAEF